MGGQDTGDSKRWRRQGRWDQGEVRRDSQCNGGFPCGGSGGESRWESLLRGRVCVSEGRDEREEEEGHACMYTSEEISSASPQAFCEVVALFDAFFGCFQSTGRGDVFTSGMLRGYPKTISTPMLSS